MKKREESYYVELCKQVAMTKCINSNKDFEDLIDTVDTKLGFNVTSSGYKEAIIDKALTILKGKVTFEIIQKDRMPGQRGRVAKDRRIYVNCDESDIPLLVKRYYVSGNQQGGLNKDVRDITVSLADELMKNKKIDRLNAIGQAKKILGSISSQKLFIERLFELVKQAYESQVMGFVESDQVKAIFGSFTSRNDIKDLTERLSLYNIKLDLEVSENKQDKRKWVVKVDGNLKDKLVELQKLGKKYKLDLKWVEVKHNTKEEKKTNTLLASTGHYDKDKYIAFMIGGLIQREGKSVNLDTVCSLFNGNSYHDLRLVKSEVIELVRDNKDLFDLSGGNREAISLKPHAWDILKKLSPVNYEREVTWIVNSGLSLEEIKEVFYDSKEVGVGKCQNNTKVIKIKTNWSIKSFQRMARLYMKMRDCDFTTEENLIDELKREINRQFRRLDKSDIAQQCFHLYGNTGMTVEDKDNLLAEIENRYS